MRRGTTPTHTFTLPFDVDMLKEIRVIYAQGGETIFVRTAAECELNGNTVTIKLTQEETLAFECHKPVRIQVRALTMGGDALASDILEVVPSACLENEVME